MSRASSLRMVLEEATAEQAQLALSLLIWPTVAPMPSVVDEYVRRQKAANSEPHAAFFVAALPVPSHLGHLSTRRSSSLGPGT